MQTRNRSKPVIYLSLFLALLTVVFSVISAWNPMTVLAEKNTKIEQLIMVEPYANNHMKNMQDAVKKEYEHLGADDTTQHEWLYSLENVMSKVSSNDEKRKKQAIVIWTGGKWLDNYDKDTDYYYGRKFKDYYNRSNLGSDSDADLDEPTYNGTAFARMLYGYDYTYEFEMKVFKKNGQELYDEDYSANGHYPADECIDGGESGVGCEKVYSSHDADCDAHAGHTTICISQHNTACDSHAGHTTVCTFSATINGVLVPNCQNSECLQHRTHAAHQCCTQDPKCVAHHAHEKHACCTQKTEKVVRTFHVKGIFEEWKEQYPDLKIYIFSTGPRSKEYLNAENLADNKAEMSEQLNEAPQKYNQAFSAIASDYIEMFEKMYQDNPYFKDETKLKGESPHYFYSDSYYQYIFHMIWNTVLELNPNDEPPEPIEETLYSVSASLTSYMNKVLSSSTQSDSGSETHELLAANTPYVGNAGAFLGFGDKDYGFKSFVTGKQSKTSSVVDYSALLGVEGKDASHSTNEMYLYARYGYLLKDLGLDDTSTRLPFGSAHMIPGALMYLVYILSEGITLVFSKIIELLMLLNPFQFFANATEIVDSAKTSMQNTKHMSVPLSLLNFVGSTYDALSKFGLGVSVPFFLVLLLAGALLLKQNDMGNKVKMFVARIIFICIGVPMLGVFYTSTLEDVGTFAYNSVSSGTQLVSSTFVDFKGWAQQYRLSPLSDDTLGKTVLESSSVGDGGSLAGQASDNSYNNLRKTAAIINKKTGAIDAVNWDDFKSSGALTDVQKWSTIGLTEDGHATNKAFKQASSLLQSYLLGDFYTAGTWESDVMSTMTANHRDKLGRQQGLEEQDAVDNTNTIYEMFSETNEYSKWDGRTAEENQNIFKQTGDYVRTTTDGKWKDFNIFANGRLQAHSFSVDADGNISVGGVNNTLGADKNVAYKEGTEDNVSHGGMCPDSTIGLSTMSMYNYLSTTFDSGQMIIYSNAKAPSEYTKQQHYAVNLIGSGAARGLYFMSCFSVLFVSSIIGVYYAISMIVQNLKRSLKLLTSIPGAMMGSIQSIASTIVMVVMMIAELIATMVAYMLVAELLVAFVQLIESPLADWVNDSLATSLIGGHIAHVGSVDLSVLVGSKVGLFVNMAVSILIVMFIGFTSVKYAKRFVHAYSLVSEYLILKYFVPTAVRESYFRQEAESDVEDTVSVLGLTKELLWQ